MTDTKRALDAFNRLVRFHKYENLVELAADETIVRECLEAQTWRYISMAPKDGTRFIGWSFDDGRHVMWFECGSFVREGDMENYVCNPTHWAPLLDMPETGDNE